MPTILAIGDIHAWLNSKYQWQNPDIIKDRDRKKLELIKKVVNLTKPDLFVNLWDNIINTNQGRTEKDNKAIDKKTFKKVVNTLSPRVLKTTVKYAVGNHDTKTIPQNKLKKIIHEKKLYNSFDKNWIHYIILFPKADKKTWISYIWERQISWLKDDLENNDSKQCIVFSHYPLVNLWMDWTFFKDNEEKWFVKNWIEVEKMIKKKYKEPIIVSWHTHKGGLTTNDWIINVSVPAVTSDFKKNDTANKIYYVLINTDWNKILIENKEYLGE